MKMPATTIVAAWMRADTGVGPAMASGSQVWRMNWPDFDMTAAMQRARRHEQHEVADLAARRPSSLISRMSKVCRRRRRG